MAKRQTPRIARLTRSDMHDKDVTITSTRTKEEQTTEAKASAFLAKARKMYQQAAEFWAPIHKKQLEDRRFSSSDQWEERAASLRRAANKPVITLNYMPGIIQQVVNPSMLTRPGIQITPIDSNTDKATAEVLQDLTRTIERNSDADSAYFRGHNDQVDIGLGFWRLLREYEADDSTDQVLKVRRVRNPFSVLFVPPFQEMDFRDAAGAFVLEDVPRDSFREQYGEEAMQSMELWSATAGTSATEWMPGGKIRTAEFFYAEAKKVEIVGVLIPNPMGGPAIKRVIPKTVYEATKDKLEAVKGEVFHTRVILQRTIKWAKISGAAILSGNEDKTEGREWGGPFIPVIPVVGREIDINGELDYRGVTRDAKAPCRMINYAASAIAEAVGSAPKSPFLIEYSQLQGLEKYWDSLNEVTHPYLPYKAKALDGRLVPPPQRMVTEAQIQALVQAYALAEAQLRAVTSMYEDVLGQQGNERSGKAILARQSRGDLGASHFQQNWHRAIKFTGEQMISLIPGTYDAERIVRIIGVDGKTRSVMLKQGPPNVPQGMTREQWMQQQGISGIYDISVGKYDVAVSAGPSYPARRQEAQAAMVEMVRAYPQVFPVIGDLLVEYSDWPGSEQIASRLRKMLDPKLQDTDSPMSDPAAEAKIQQLTMQLEQVSQQAQQMQDMLKTEAQKLSAQVQMKQMEVQSRERIESAKLQVEAASVLATLDAKKAETMLKAELQRIDASLQLMLAAADRKAAATQGDDNE